MRKAEVVIFVVMAIVWISAGFVVEQKIYHEVNGGCDKQKVLVPVLLDEKCKPNILIRNCKEASSDYKVTCW